MDPVLNNLYKSKRPKAIDLSAVFTYTIKNISKIFQKR
jgi:hypothetical protein